MENSFRISDGRGLVQGFHIYAHQTESLARAITREEALALVLLPTHLQ